jgi:type II secretory pathway component PulC
MVRGLIIRQVFVLLDLALVILILVTGALVSLAVLRPPENMQDNDRSDVSADSAARFYLANVPSRSEYDALLSGGLFGAAGRFDPNAAPPPPPPPPVEDDLKETELNLKLHGTIALSPRNPFASAFIEDLDARSGSMAFALGQDVVDQVKLMEVYPREVVLLNERNAPPTRERLRMDEEESASRVAAAPSRQMPERASQGRQVELNRQELIQELYMNYADLVTKVRPEMYRDASGKVVGVTAQNISQVPLAEKLGLADGDVLQTVNNEAIDSEQKIMEMVQKHGNSNTFRIGILRNGKPQIITYRLN